MIGILEQRLISCTNMFQIWIDFVMKHLERVDVQWNIHSMYNILKDSMEALRAMYDWRPL